MTRILSIKIITISLFFLGTCLSAAPTIIPVPRNIQQAYASGTRDKSGSPGNNYWQNREDYTIKVSFDPGTRKITGTVVYTE